MYASFSIFLGQNLEFSFLKLIFTIDIDGVETVYI